MARAQTQLAIYFTGQGNYPKALTYLLNALKQEEELKNNAGIAQVLSVITDYYYEQDDLKQELVYAKKAYTAAKPLKNGDFTGAALNLGWSYFDAKHPDSALSCFLEAYQSAIKNNSYLGYAYDGLGISYGMLGNYDLALPYYRKGTQMDIKFKDGRQLSYVYRYLSQMYEQKGNADSGLYYAQKALTWAYYANNSKEKLASYTLLAKVYEGIDDHKSVEYFNKEGFLSDSVHSAEKNKEVENLNFNEHERQQELIERARKDAEQRKENLQLSAIALFIPIFFLVILLLSRTKTHRRIIEFMSVLSLLMAFEFITLLIHPWIERLTNNTPVLELIIFVVLAAILVPLHHNSTRWLKEKMAHKQMKEPAKAA